MTETYELTIDDHVAAIGDLIAAHADEIMAGPIGRVDRRLDVVERWGWRIGAVGGPLLLAVPLLGQPGLRWIGWLALLAAPVLLVIVIVFQRVGAAVERRFDRVGDGLIDRTLARDLQKDIARGRIHALLGEVTVTRDAGRIEARSATHTVIIPDVRAAWRHSSADRLLLARTMPASRSTIGDLIILPAGGPIAGSLEDDPPSA